MEPTVESATQDRGKTTKVVAGAILCVLLIFLVIQLIGSPIVTLGSLAGSVLYSVAVFIPVAVVCVLAIVKSGKKA